MQELIGLAAAATTIIAGAVVASNLGTRITGWGFVLFTLASGLWLAAGWVAADASLMTANAIMAVINAFGAWRWLGRQSRLETGSDRAMARSRTAPVPSLFSAASVLGAPLTERAGEQSGTVIDLMMRCGDRDLSYAVIGLGGVGGIGERFRAVPADQLQFTAGEVRCLMDLAALEALPDLAPDAWPAAPPEPG